MFVPYHVDVPMARLPFANWVLIGCTVLISGYVLLTPPPRPEEAQIPPELRALYRFTRNAVDRPPPPLSLRRDGREFSFLQLFSHVLVHGDALHLVGNMVFLFFFGNVINAKLGHLPFVAVYFLMALVAGVAWLLLGEGKAVAGASGAIMGVVGVFVVLYPRNNVLVRIRGFGWREVSAFWVVLLGMAADLGGTLSSTEEGAAYVGHLAGELFGVVLTCGLLVTELVESSEGEENLLQLLGLQAKAQGEESSGYLPRRRR